jgi:hypothetical protein
MHRRKKRIKNHDHKKRSRDETTMKKTIKTMGRGINIKQLQRK